MKTITLLAAALVAGVASADKVVLKSGSFLTGTAGVLQGDVLAFDSEDLGTVSVKVASIASLESDRKHVVQYVDNRRVEAFVTVSNGVYMTESGPMDMTNVKALDPAVEKWHGSVNVAFQSSRGNTYQNSATVLANVSRRWEFDRFNGNFGYYTSETGTSKDSKEKTTDRWEVEGQHDHFWRSAFYTYENARYEEDDIAGLNSRIRLGLGGGYQWLDNRKFDRTGTWSFSQEAGVAWISNDYRVKDSSADESYASPRYAHHLKYLPKWNPGVEGFHNLEYYPQLEDFENYLMRADVGFTTKIVLSLDLLAKIEWDYNSRPSVGRKSSDVRYIVGLGYKW